MNPSVLCLSAVFVASFAYGQTQPASAPDQTAQLLQGTSSLVLVPTLVTTGSDELVYTLSAKNFVLAVT